jgi:hypothetical protein
LVVDVVGDTVVRDFRMRGRTGRTSPCDVESLVHGRDMDRHGVVLVESLDTTGLPSTDEARLAMVAKVERRGMLLVMSTCV